MKKQNVTGLMKNIQTATSKHSPEILTALGIAGMLSTTVLAVKATPKALRLIEEARTEKGKELTAVETIELCWKCYIPAIGTGVFSTMCLIGANSVNSRRNAALATAYKLSETAFADYKEKIIETIGEKKEQSVRESIAKDKLDRDSVNNATAYRTGRGETKCYDALTGATFYSDIDYVKNAVNKLNSKMLNEEYVSLNDFYDELNIPHINIGDDVGWNIGRDGMINIDYYYQKDATDHPCLVLDYMVAPRYDYSKLM